MRRWMPGCALLALAIVAAFPFLPPARFYFLDDGFLHLFRLFEFDRVLRQGVLYPRWAPDFAYGYGYPLFNFYPPLAYYVAEALHLLGLDVAGALDATFLVILALAVAGAYALGCELFAAASNPCRSGILTAVAYVCFPYFLLDIYVRGALAEALAAAILPWTLWALRRAVTRQTISAGLIAALALAALILAHNLTTLLAAPVLCAFVLFDLFHLPIAPRFHALGRAIAAGLLGVLLAALYWLPMLAELSLVAISRESKQLAAMFTFLAPADVVQLAAPYQYHDEPYPLGFVPMVLSALALIATVQRGDKARGVLLFFGVVTLAAALLLPDWAKGIWLNVPLLRTVQFPWRVSVVIGLGVAVLIGSLPNAFPSRNRERLSSIVLAALALLLIWNGLANLSPRRLENPRGDLTLGQMARFETNTRGLGFGSLGEYLPLTVKALPRELNSPRTDTSPPTINLVECNSTRCAFTVSAERSVPISLRAFYFPGWQATIDEQPAPVYPSTPMGLLTVNVPGGSHRVAFSFGDTLPRQLGAALSGLGVIVLVALTGFAFRREREARLVAVVLGSGFVIGAIIVVVALTGQSPALQSTQVDVSPELRLIGLRFKQGTESLDVQVYWQVKQPLSEKPFAWRLVDGSGRAWASREQLARYGTGFAAAWVANEIVEDHYDLSLDSTIPPGKYTLEVAFSGNAFVPVSALELERAAPSADPQITRRLDARVGDRIHLVGLDAPAVARPGQIVPLTLYWRADRDVHEDLTVFAQLLDADGNLVAQHDELTDNGFNPTMLWSPGKIVADRRSLALPSDVSPGLYRLVAGLYRFETLERLPVTMPAGSSPDDQIELGVIKVPLQAPVAPPAHALDVSLGAAIRLRGYDLAIRDTRGNVVAGNEGTLTARVGQMLALKLYWQAISKMDADNKVFVHIMDEQGNVAAQQDRTPGNGRYSTTLWSPGEQVSDDFLLPLNLAPGRYQVVVGMYDARSGERLVAAQSNGQELVNRQIEIGQLELTAP